MLGGKAIVGSQLVKEEITDLVLVGLFMLVLLLLPQSKEFISLIVCSFTSLLQFLTMDEINCCFLLAVDREMS